MMELASDPDHTPTTFNFGLTTGLPSHESDAAMAITPISGPAVLKIEETAPEIQQVSDPSEIAGIQNDAPLFEREDWTLYRSTNTLPQKAGVPLDDLPKLAAKEINDNGLDKAGMTRVGLLPGKNGFFVEDDGSGIPGTDADVARLFSIRRPLTSSKLIRLPTRGALGNGLRVVAGMVLATRGGLIVTTRGRTLKLAPRDDGSTDHENLGPSTFQGTRVEVWFGGHAFRVDDDDLLFAEDAIEMARAAGPTYQGKTSPHWYDADSFWELCQAGGRRTARELIAEFFDGCSEPTAGKIASVLPPGTLANSLGRRDASRLLIAAKGRAKPVNPARLGCVGPKYLPSWSHAKVAGEWNTETGIKAPVVVEAWAISVKDDDDAAFEVCVNRSPIAAETPSWIDKAGQSKTQVLHGCAIQIRLKIGRSAARVVVNIETPYMPITTDGKTPNLGGIRDLIVQATAKTMNRLRRSLKAGDRPSQKELIVAAIPAGAAKMSGDGELRFSLRQLFYAVREVVKRQMPPTEDNKPFELNYGYFTQVVTDYEAEHGDVPGMYRDPRGTLYHPHAGEEISLGTIAVEKYSRPQWTFNKVLYCEKEGFTEIMKSVGWPERNDCALVSSKGYASRAVRDVFDLLGETDEKITFFCVHDADAYGTMILQSLREATRARGARKVEVVDLGLDPAEAIAMGLEVEPVSGDQLKPVAEYVTPQWRRWLQTNRVELNAMTTRQFIDWLDARMAPHSGKVIPPSPVLVDQLGHGVRAGVRDAITRRVLAEAGIDGLVERAVIDRTDAIGEAAASLPRSVADALAENPGDLWSVPVARIAGRIAAAGPIEGSD